jgi:hypothetical protein
VSAPSKAKLKRLHREADQAALDKAALDFWFEVSGTTMADLEALCERYPSVTKGGIPVMGAHAEIGAAVFEHRDRINHDAAIMILRAMQRVAQRVTTRWLAARRPGAQLALLLDAPPPEDAP